MLSLQELLSTRSTQLLASIAELVQVYVRQVLSLRADKSFEIADTEQQKDRSAQRPGLFRAIKSADVREQSAQTSALIFFCVIRHFSEVRLRTWILFRLHASVTRLPFHIDKLCQFRLPHQLDGSDRTVSLFCDDDLRHIRLLGRLIVIIIAV